jgi:MarR family transcriptional regulator, organic hydroperoxide resistance regulator
MNDKELATKLLKDLWNNRPNRFNNFLDEFNKGEFGLLNYIYFETKEVSAGMLSEKLKVSTARIASILNSLEAKKLIKRKIGTDDKRKVVVEITAEGKKIIKKYQEEIVNKVSYIISRIGQEKAKQYFDIMLEINSIINDKSDIK